MPLDQSQLAGANAERLEVTDVVGRETNLKQPTGCRTAEHETRQGTDFAYGEPLTLLQWRSPGDIAICYCPTFACDRPRIGWVRWRLPSASAMNPEANQSGQQTCRSGRKKGGNPEQGFGDGQVLRTSEKNPEAKAGGEREQRALHEEGITGYRLILSECWLMGLFCLSRMRCKPDKGLATVRWWEEIEQLDRIDPVAAFNQEGHVASEGRRLATRVMNAFGTQCRQKLQ